MIVQNRRRYSINQQSPEWFALKAKFPFSSSIAAVAVGTSIYQTIDECLDEIKFGITREITPELQRIFDRGHKIEALTRPKISEKMGEEFYASVHTAEIILDDGTAIPLLASLDGENIDGSTIWECKTWNDKIYQYIVENNDLPPSHWPQVEHAMMVSGALDCLFTLANEEREFSFLYKFRPERFDKVKTAWVNFYRLLETHERRERAPVVVGVSPLDTIPPLSLVVAGEVKDSNLSEFTIAAKTAIATIKTDLATDQDFADAEKAAKYCADIEDRVRAAKKSALDQTVTLAELFSTLDEIGEFARSKRLALEKLVKTKKDDIRAKMVRDARAKYSEAVARKGAPIGVSSFPADNFADVIKSKRTIESIQSAIDAEYIRLITDAERLVQVATVNKTLIDATPGAASLVPDFNAVAFRDPEAFAGMLQYRIDAQKRALEAAQKPAPEPVAAPDPEPELEERIEEREISITIRARSDRPNDFIRDQIKSLFKTKNLGAVSEVSIRKKGD